MNTGKSDYEIQQRAYKELTPGIRVPSRVQKIIDNEADERRYDIERLRKYGVPDEEIDRLLEHQEEQIADFIQGERAKCKMALRIEKLEKEVTADELTGLNNKKGFEKTIQTFIALADREHQKNAEENARRKEKGEEEIPVKLSLLMVDIDKFKLVNDLLGHGVGDKVLRQFGEITQRTVRESDYPARIGGEEFAVIFPQTNGVAIVGAERLRKAMERDLRPMLKEAFDKLLNNRGVEYIFIRAKESGLLDEPMGITKSQKGEEDRSKKFDDLSEREIEQVCQITKDSLLGTVSVGVASYQVGESKEGLKERADEALYFAKENGRNRVCNAKELRKIGVEKKRGLANKL